MCCKISFGLSVLYWHDKNSCVAKAYSNIMPSCLHRPPREISAMDVHQAISSIPTCDFLTNRLFPVHAEIFVCHQGKQKISRHFLIVISRNIFFMKMSVVVILF